MFNFKKILIIMKTKIISKLKSGKLYHIIIKSNRLMINNQEFDIDTESCISFYAAYPKDTEINLRNILLPFIKLPKSFKKMRKLWKQNIEQGLCYDSEKDKHV